ncbi:MAG: hypothetical protein H6993_15080 [Pseudomonadales bacterium]|nr:hypothetical protein [Pseudomonadales bacterium]MCP5185286.1 hypothetical protein [Pseudomonadales bacterium]
MSTRPRVSPPQGMDTANFGTVMQHLPDTINAFFDLYADFWRQGALSVTVKEMTRLRNARITDCGY